MKKCINILLIYFNNNFGKILSKNEKKSLKINFNCVTIIS